MKQLAKSLPAPALRVLLATVLAAGGLSGCGSFNPRDPLHPSGGRRTGDAAPVAPGKPGKGGKSKPVAPVTPAADAPIETYLADGLRLPSRLKAQSLKVSFRSNFPDVFFECAEGPGSLVDTTALLPCTDEAGYDFGRLAHGQAYVLRVRAVRHSDGRADATPLVIAFVADLTTGSPVVQQTNVTPVVVDSAADLPSAAEGGRLLQVGSFYGVASPASYLVTSYATTKTYNDSIMSLRLTGRTDLSTIYDGRPCDSQYERQATGPDGLSYCEATPTRSEWQDVFTVPMPFNHLEIARTDITSGSGTTAEKLFVASYDAAESDPTEDRLGIGETCQSAMTRGESLVPLVYGFYEASPTKVPFTWCQTSDRFGRSWWVGAFKVALGTEAGAPELRVIYTANAQLGIFSGSQFALRAGDFIAPILVPIAPAPNP